MQASKTNPGHCTLHFHLPLVHGMIPPDLWPYSTLSWMHPAQGPGATSTHLWGVCLSHSSRSAGQRSDVTYGCLQDITPGLCPRLALRDPLLFLVARPSLLGARTDSPPAFMHFRRKRAPTHTSGSCCVENCHWEHIRYPKSDASLCLGNKMMFLRSVDQARNGGKRSRKIEPAPCSVEPPGGQWAKPLNCFLEECRPPANHHLAQEQCFYFRIYYRISFKLKLL